MTSQVIRVERGPASVRSGADHLNISPVSHRSGISGTNPGNFVRTGINRQIADFGLPQSRQNNVGNQGQPSRKYYPATAHSVQDGIDPFDDNSSEYSCMSLPQHSHFGGLSQAALPTVNYQSSQLREHVHRKPGQLVVAGPQFSELGSKRERSTSPGDPLNATHSTTTFSYQTGVEPGSQGKAFATAYCFRDDNAMPQEAEMSAMIEEQKAYERERTKQERLNNFNAKTATQAQQKLKALKQNAKNEAEQKKLAQREVLIKQKQYAAQQREQAAKKAQQKKDKLRKQKAEQAEPQPDAYIQTHARTHHPGSKHSGPVNVDLGGAIHERDDESEQSRIYNEEEERARIEMQNRQKTINLFKRIDQHTLCDVGLQSKQALGKDAVEEVHSYSTLQRFRSNKDLHSFDRSKPMPLPKATTQDDESDSEDEEENFNHQNNLHLPLGSVGQPSQINNALQDARNKRKTINGKQVTMNEDQEVLERKWWIGSDPDAAKRSIQAKKEQAKHALEKERYIKALKVLVTEKGARISEADMPSLCSCGALKNNVVKAAKQGGDADFEMCASNCQFYMNTKGYERALRDILHCISLFK